MLRRGLKDDSGSWNTICILRRIGRQARSPHAVMSCPVTRIRPALGRYRRNTVFPNVVLPDPGSPTTPNTSPRPNERLAPSTARKLPEPRVGKATTRLLTSRTGWDSTIEHATHEPARAGFD